MSNRTRVTGMYSGFDTEGLISQLVEARRAKVTSVSKDQMTIQFKQETWKDLNKKLKSLQTKFDKIRYQSAYAKKSTTVSDKSVASVVTSDGAMNATQTLKVKSLAKAGYATGGEIKTEDGSKATSGTLLSDLKYGDQKIADGAGFSVTVGGKTTDINITSSTTLGDIAKQLSNAGVNANFDSATQRIFIGAKDTGTDHEFAITANNEDGLKALSVLGILDDFTDTKTQTYKQYQAISNMDAGEAIAKETEKRVAALVSDYNSIYKGNASNREKLDKMQEEFAEKHPGEDITTFTDEEAEELKTLKEKSEPTDDEKARIEMLTAKETYAEGVKIIAENEEKLDEIKNSINIDETEEDGSIKTASAKDSLTTEVTDFVNAKIDAANEMLAMASGSTGDYRFSSRVNAEDASIELNGATFTGSSNTFNVNGLTITAQKETGDDFVTLNTSNDTSAMYNMIKDVVKEYSELINELDKLYGADTKTKYKPLTDEEKAAMSDYEVEKWESKMKEQLLAKDANLNTLRSGFTGIMNQGFKVGDKTMYLFDFGIETAGYFNAAEDEKNALHIKGDEDDTLFSTETNKLKEMIASDPDTVTDFFSQLSNAVYKKMTEMSSRQAGYRSYGSFYDDVRMKTDYDDYTSKIADMEEKLSKYEDKWYDKFSKMETAMAKMQSNQNALAGMLGG